MASVFWDSENCQVPTGKSVYELKRDILSIVKSKYNYIDKLDKIEMIGKTKGFRAGLIKELFSEDIHINKGITVKNLYKKGAADNELISSMHELMHCIKNKDRVNPYVIVLISGDSDFTRVLNFAKELGFKVIIFHSINVNYEFTRIGDLSVPWSIFNANRRLNSDSSLLNVVSSIKPIKPIKRYCKVMLFFNDIVNEYVIPVDLKVDLMEGDIVKVEDFSEGMHSKGWNIGYVVSIHTHLQIKPTLKILIRYKTKKERFYKVLKDKMDGDCSIFRELSNIQDLTGLNILIIDCELRWDSRAITILYLNLSNGTLDFTEFLKEFRKRYNTHANLVEKKRCPRRYCDDSTCDFYHFDI